MSARILPKSGEVYHHLSATGNWRSENRITEWEFDCLRCGKKGVWKPMGNVRSGAIKSCNCLESDSRGKTLRLKLKKGERFGRLTICGPSKIKNRRTEWWCKCSCNGNEDWYKGSDLRYKNTLSCGCFKRDKAAKNAEKRGKYPVLLTNDERTDFRRIPRSKKPKSKDKIRAQILLLADKTEGSLG